MSRTIAAVLLFFSLPVLLAAPVPPKPPRPWVHGWDKQVDPPGDCRFDRKGDRLTITVPGSGRKPDHLGVVRRIDPSLDLLDRPLTVPHLLRRVEGDFVCQVCVRGGYPKAGAGNRLGRPARAGILLLSGRNAAEVSLRVNDPEGVKGSHCTLVGTLAGQFSAWGPEDEHLWTKFEAIPDRRAYLRLERRGDAVRLSYSTDGETWDGGLLGGGKLWWLGREVKVGVYTVGAGRAAFQAEFDQFKLTPLRGSRLGPGW